MIFFMLPDEAFTKCTELSEQMRIIRPYGDKFEVSKQLLIFLNTYLSKYFKQIKFLKIAYIVKIN